MGLLSRFDLRDYDVECFVETGTWKGDGLRYARSVIEECHSIELNAAFFKAAEQEFPNCHLHFGDSPTVLRTLLPTIVGKKTFFWLDAHLPQLYEGHSFPPSKELEMPLAAELDLIRNLKDFHKDVILIDDLRVFDQGPFQNGDICYREDYGSTGIDFIRESFGESHQILRLYGDEGYILLLPK